MSQHYFETTYQNRPVRVTLCWDKPLQTYHLMVEWMDADRYVYTNLQEKRPYEFELEDYRAKLEVLGIHAPASMFEQARRDQIAKGNRYVYHKGDGNFVEHFLPAAPTAVEQRRGMPFKLGDVTMTAGVYDYCKAHCLLPTAPVMLVARHAMGDWGEICEEDRDSNQFALIHGGRIMSVYRVGSRKVWVVTEADRSVTTLLFPDEY